MPNLCHQFLKYYTGQVKVRYLDVSFIQMFVIQIPTVVIYVTEKGSNRMPWLLCSSFVKDLFLICLNDMFVCYE